MKSCYPVRIKKGFRKKSKNWSLQKFQRILYVIHIVLCADKSESAVKYTLPENETHIFASKYKLYLPSEEELSQELQREYRALEYDKKTATALLKKDIKG